MDCPLAFVELWKSSLTLYLCVHVRVRVFGISRDKGRIVKSKVSLNPLYCCRTSSSSTVNDPSDQYEDTKNQASGSSSDEIPGSNLRCFASFTLNFILNFTCNKKISGNKLNHTCILIGSSCYDLLKDNKDDVTIYKALLFKLI